MLTRSKATTSIASSSADNSGINIKYIKTEVPQVNVFHTPVKNTTRDDKGKALVVYSLPEDEEEDEEWDEEDDDEYFPYQPNKRLKLAYPTTPPPSASKKSLFPTEYFASVKKEVKKEEEPEEEPITDKKTIIQDLPPDVLIELFRPITCPMELSKLGEVCRSFRLAVCNAPLWTGIFEWYDAIDVMPALPKRKMADPLRQRRIKACKLFRGKYCHRCYAPSQQTQLFSTMPISAQLKLTPEQEYRGPRVRTCYDCCRHDFVQYRAERIELDMYEMPRWLDRSKTTTTSRVCQSTALSRYKVNQTLLHRFIPYETRRNPHYRSADPMILFPADEVAILSDFQNGNLFCRHLVVSQQQQVESIRKMAK